MEILKDNPDERKCGKGNALTKPFLREEIQKNRYAEEERMYKQKDNTCEHQELVCRDRPTTNPTNGDHVENEKSQIRIAESSTIFLETLQQNEERDESEASKDAELEGRKTKAQQDA